LFFFDNLDSDVLGKRRNSDSGGNLIKVEVFVNHFVRPSVRHSQFFHSVSEVVIGRIGLVAGRRHVAGNVVTINPNAEMNEEYADEEAYAEECEEVEQYVPLVLPQTVVIGSRFS